MAARGFVGAGDIYIARYDPTTASFGPYVGPLEASKFEITPKTNKLEMKSKSRDNYNNVVEAVNLPEPFEFAVEFAEINGDTLANAFLGTKASINQAAGVLTAMPLIAKLDGWVDVGRRNLIVAGLMLENSAGTVTYVLGTDYEVNYRLGSFKALVGGAILDNAALTVTGTNGLVTGTRIQGGRQADIRAKFRFDGKNLADNLPTIVEVWEGVVAADSAFDFMSDDFNMVSVTGTLKTPADKSSPFEVDMLNQAI